jgi:hypothetical protein
MRCEREEGRRKDKGETLGEVRHNISKNFMKLHFINTKETEISY